MQKKFPSLKKSKAICKSRYTSKHTLVLPHFTYCLNVWNDGCCAHIEKLHKLHKRAT